LRRRLRRGSTTWCAHSARRVVRVRGDTAGAAIMASLIVAVRATPSIRVLEGVSVTGLTVRDGRVAGVAARDGAGHGLRLDARAVVLATGGIGGLYAVTSNPKAVMGQGLGIAARAGALLCDAEFVQFHPTGLAVAADPVPLASEALRGEGAVLIDAQGRPVMAGLHPDGDLAPRDVVARALHARVARGEAVFLDTRRAIGADLAARFPTLAAGCAAAGIDPVRDPIPVRPVQHYHGRRAHRGDRAQHARRALGRGRGGGDRAARGEPACVELAAGGGGLRRAGGRGHRRLVGSASGRSPWSRRGRAVRRLCARPRRPSGG
jgi:aspartate oxidase